MFKNPFSFEGRIRRTEFGISYIIYSATAFIFSMVLEKMVENGDDNIMLLILIYLAYIPLIWFLIAQAAKRSHDRGNSGWYQIIPFYALWLLFADSESGKNEYGLNPKGFQNLDEINEIGIKEN